MKTETVHEIEIPKVGFGTWQIGGRSRPEPSTDKRSLEALRSALELGYRHFDTAEHYAGGHAEELLGQALRTSGTPRQQVFITSKVWPNHLRYADTLKSCEASLRRLGMDYIDLYLVHWYNPLFPLPETFRALNELVKAGKVRHLGVSNFDVKQLKSSQKLADSPILTDQVPYSLSDRNYVKNGVLAYCQDNDILLTAYEPIKGGKLHRKAVKEIAARRGLTEAQVAIAWLTAQDRVITIPMSFDREHQVQNLKAGEVDLTIEELEALNEL